MRPLESNTSHIIFICEGGVVVVEYKQLGIVAHISMINAARDRDSNSRRLRTKYKIEYIANEIIVRYDRQ